MHPSAPPCRPFLFDADDPLSFKHISLTPLQLQLIGW
jgi:hypothetical protein